MTDAIRCDRCHSFQLSRHTIAGTVAMYAFGKITGVYTDTFDLCTDCAAKLEQLLHDWCIDTRPEWKEHDD